MPALVHSKKFPFSHGFSTREGGVSTGSHATLNLGFSVGDEPARVEENLRRLANRAGLIPSALRTVTQVHGDRVLQTVPLASSEGLSPACGEADAIWTELAGEAVGIKTADCVPILLGDSMSGRVAAIHSGWRGTVAEVSARAVETLVAQGSQASALHAAIGPAIQRCCYQVSPDLIARFRTQFGDEVIEGDRLDLPRAVEQSLLRAGVPASQIDRMPD
jgi:YfiH family protein